LAIEIRPDAAAMAALFSRADEGPDETSNIPDRMTGALTQGVRDWSQWSRICHWNTGWDTSLGPHGRSLEKAQQMTALRPSPGP